MSKANGDYFAALGELKDIFRRVRLGNQFFVSFSLQVLCADV